MFYDYLFFIFGFSIVLSFYVMSFVSYLVPIIVILIMIMFELIADKSFIRSFFVIRIVCVWAIVFACLW